tara:strand:+ start:6743 stop:7024 length:282 start_codon:yes stop_codon:yes gene_type:complete
MEPNINDEKTIYPTIMVDFSLIDSPRPNRLVLGFFKGLLNAEKEFGGTEFDKGFELGRKVRLGEIAPPDWCYRPESDCEGDTLFDFIDDQSIS